MSLPATHRFKLGSSGRKMRARVLDANGVLLTKAQLDALSTLRVRARRTHQPRGQATTINHTTVDGVDGATTWNLDIDVSTLAPGRWWVETEVDDGTGLQQPPEDLATPGVEIDVFEDVG